MSTLDIPPLFSDAGGASSLNATENAPPSLASQSALAAAATFVTAQPLPAPHQPAAVNPPRAPPWGHGWVGGGLLFIAAVYLLREAQPLMVPIAVAVVLTLVLSAPVRYLARHRIPEFIGAGLLVLAVVGGIALVGTTLLVPASEWWDRAPTSVDQLFKQVERVRASIGIPAPVAATPAATPAANPAPAPPSATSEAPSKRRAGGAATEQPGDETPAAPAAPPQDPVKEKIVTESVAFTGLVIGQVFSLGISTVATLILLYFLLASEHWMLSRTVEAIDRRRTRALVLSGVRTAQREIGRFISALSIINFGVGVVTIGLMAAIGLPNPVLWGTLAAVLNFIPYLGAIIVVGVLLLAGVASFADQPSLIMLPAAAFFLVHTIEANLITPWFVGRQLALSRISVFLSVMFWGWLWGIVGALLAVPVLIGLRAAFRRQARMRRLCVYLDEQRRPPPSLRSLLRRGGGLLRHPLRPQPVDETIDGGGLSYRRRR